MLEGTEIKEAPESKITEISLVLTEFVLYEPTE
jgi:hypothetical protein